MCAAKLTAGGVDVGAKLAADGGADAPLLQNGGKGLHRLVGGAGEARFLYLVDGDEIDVDGHGGGAGAEVAVEDVGQLGGPLGGVVLTRNQGSQSPATAHKTSLRAEA